MKHGVYSDYDPAQSGLAESALITLWPSLEPWYDDLVLVGGLVPRYICAHTSAPGSLPRPVTLDADLGIALAASAGGMASLRFALMDQGFQKSATAEGLIRYEKKTADCSIPVDFLTESPPHTA